MSFEGFDDLLAFAAVATTGSFRAAAEQLARDPSVISRRLTQLEHRLGVRLLVRTTRSVTLTEAGTFYFRRIGSVLDELDMATREVGGFAASPQGILKISLPVTIGRELIAPLLPDFLLKYPNIHLDAHFLDRTVDIVREGFDVVIRTGTIRDSSLIARRLTAFRSILVAAPTYLDKWGTPENVEDLQRHATLGFTTHADWPLWILEKDGEEKSIKLNGPLSANSLEAIFEAAVKGVGVAMVPPWMAMPFFKNGLLSEVLPGWRSIRNIGIHAVMPPGALIPAKTRVFVDEIAASLQTK
ncbi:MAG: LysR family transcriptional regulator [Paludibacterium sp.]|uniref:LysR family transcriptional regulator n=1 Tax=Paludibacterium sp. TaxID=1917523 RepID=UPI0025D3792F|nr:LysR family transcriptional regulator [Paludibacterium sp.]MBV8049475.1 LysR family transcriptional regulator [Paludibacterium sp.]MBV8647551.1 LysR family transcriptional regulator [Paludibacterium sp.]